jgi:hypothetical protein
MGGGGGGGVDAGEDAGSADSGVDSGVPQPFCALGLSCAEWQDCAPTLDGGACVDGQYTVTWTAPMNGARFAADASVVAQVVVSKVGGGAVPFTAVPVSGDVTGQLSGSGGTYSGDLGRLQGAEGSKTIIAGWRDGGPTVPLSVVLDTTAPGFSVSLVNAPSYGGDGGFLDADPASPSAIKKDETVTLRVTSLASDVDPSSLAMVVTGPGAVAWDAGTPQSCSAVAFCREYTLALGPQPMSAFSGTVTAQVSGRDDVGNSSSSMPASFSVTRWRWARQISSSYGVRTTPALADGGVLIVGINGSATPNGIVAVKPDGTVAWGPTNDGPVEGSAAVGRSDAGTEFLFYQTANATNAMRAVAALNGSPTGNVCDGVASPLSKASLAILENGTDDVMAVGTQPASSSTLAVVKRATASCRDVGGSPAYSSVQFPGNVAASGASAYWVGSNGLLRGASWSASNLAATSVNLSIGGVGTVNGLAFVSGSKVAGGGGGGPGIGKIFTVDFSAAGAIPGWSTATSTPMSGPIVVASGVIASQRSGSDKLQVIRVEASTGMTSAISMELSGSSFSSNQVPTPVAGQGQLLYVLDEAGRLYVLPQGFTNATQPAWSSTLPSAVAGTVSASPTLDCNRTKPASGTGVLYLATESGWLVSYIVDSRGLDATAPWPKYQRDGWNTGNTATVGFGPACP